MMTKIEELVARLTIEEKAMMITGAGAMNTLPVERLGIPKKEMSDGPHGIRSADPEADCTCFPSMCAIGATWDRDAAKRAGEGIAKDCIEHNIQMILAPGMNIKRNTLCGRNFEYISEDPILAGNLAAAYIQGCEGLGVATSLKHFAANSMETKRTLCSSELDERTLREIYLRGFEIAVREGKPQSVMCAYNKINSIWCSENRALLTEILRDEWGYEGFVVSDWGAVHDECRALMAGLDLQMPRNGGIVEKIKAGLSSGRLTEEALDKAVANVLRFALRPMPKARKYDRAAQHKAAQKLASEGICLLRNRDGILPLNPKKQKKIAVIGHLAKKPDFNGQGSAEVYPKTVDAPLDYLRNNLKGCQIDYIDCLPEEYPDTMPWPMYRRLFKDLATYDAVLIFVGFRKTADSEKIDRYDAHLESYTELMIEEVNARTNKSVVILQTGSAVFPSAWETGTAAILEMWLGGEGCGKAIADVLCGKVNPSGKLSETFAREKRKDLELVGDGLKLEYREKWEVGYRYYDRHPEEVWFPFGHGLSYTTFSYSDGVAEKTDDGVNVSFTVTNTGDRSGAEVAQIYVSDPVSTVSKPPKELRGFEKITLAAGESKRVTVRLTARDFAYYNTMLRDWIIEPGRYDILVGASSQDLRLKLPVMLENPDCYTTQKMSDDMIG